MGGDERYSVTDKGACLGQLFICKRGIKADYNSIRIVFRQLNSSVLKVLFQHWRAEQIHPGAFPMFFQVMDRYHPGGDDLALINNAAHSGQFLHVHVLILGRIVRKEKKIPAAVLHLFQEIERSFQNLISQIKGSVHVQDKVFFVITQLHAHSLPS
jgi:hypothetical protein